MEITKEFVFDSSHRLHNPNKTDEWNKETFGKCNNSPSHGHQWRLLVTVQGPIDYESGFVVNFVELKRIVNNVIVERFDHHFINDDPLLANTVPSCENMLPIFGKLLSEAFLAQRFFLRKLQLFETPTSSATLHF